MRQFVDKGYARQAPVPVLLLSCWLAWSATANGFEAADASIQREALASPGLTGGHPLPLAASWEAGWRGRGDDPEGFDPSYQVEQIDRGAFLLPWFRLPEPREPYDLQYYEQTFSRLAERRLPISFLSTQWERAAAFAAQRADGTWVPASPFSPVEQWYEAGRRWGGHPALERLEELYPDPPLVLFISNNEYPKPAWRELLNTPEVLSRSGPRASEAAQRKVISDLWVERYRAMLQGFRDGLKSAAWRSAARFIGYDSLAGSEIGRWSGWVEYSLQQPGWMEPWPQAWDGASVSFYAHDWERITDFTVWSPQVEAMNWLPTLGYVYRHKPDFWLEMSVWDGQSPGSPTDKRSYYLQRGQQFSPGRYGGMVQFGMWLLRPRVVREFRDPGAARAQFGPYFEAVMHSVARVYQDPRLAEFWRHGRLLANGAHRHPYEESLPAGFAAAQRWHLLESSANPPRPWGLETPLEVFALCLELGRQPRREWLVYAFAPLRARARASVRIPDAGAVDVQTAATGCFTLVREHGHGVETLGC